MKFLVGLTVATALLPATTLARWFPVPRHRAPAGFEFTLSSEEPFACPAGQLADGQIRLNGSYETASFFLSNGGIIDSKGFGCIVTEAPITQFQCDAGKPPAPGFSIDGANALLYHGSPSFWACPATETEYNVYVKPEFGQTKCFPITLRTNGCGAQAPPPASTLVSTSLPPSTLWETQTETVTKGVTQTVTVVTTVSSTCPAQWETTSSPGPCKHCTRTHEPGPSNSSSWSSAGPTLTPLGEIHTALSVRGVISKRDLYDDWRNLRDATNRGGRPTATQKWVRQGRFSYFKVVPGLRVGTDYFYGCTVIVIVGSQGLYFGHIAEEARGSDGTLCRALATRDETEETLIPAIEAAEDVLLNGFSGGKITPEDCPNERYAIVMGSVRDRFMDDGPAALKEWLVDGDPEVPPRNIRYTSYSKQTPLDQDPAGPYGKGLVTVDDDGVDPDTQQRRMVLRVFMHSETPRLTLRFHVDNGRFVADPEIVVANSPSTTDGTKVYNS